MASTTAFTCRPTLALPSAAHVARMRATHTQALAWGVRGPWAKESGEPAPITEPLAVHRDAMSYAERQKLDAEDDFKYYQHARFVKHVDERFLSQLTQLYRERIPEGGAALDLCSSWVSHLPRDVGYSRVVGHGMNAEELLKNDQLDEFFVRNLNQDPDGWVAVADQSMDAVVCCVSVQYLQQPERVFAEVYRVLKPGGVAIFSYSNRMFASKAISAWRDGTEYSRTNLVKSYFQAVSGFVSLEHVRRVEVPGNRGPDPLGDPLGALQFLFEKLAGGPADPFNAVVAYRNFKATHE